MMKYKTEYKIIEGFKGDFEQQCNSLSDVWVWSSSLMVIDLQLDLECSNSVYTSKNLWYSQLFSKTTQIGE